MPSSTSPPEISDDKGTVSITSARDHGGPKGSLIGGLLTLALLYSLLVLFAAIKYLYDGCVVVFSTDRNAGRSNAVVLTAQREHPVGEWRSDWDLEGETPSLVISPRRQRRDTKRARCCGRSKSVTEDDLVAGEMPVICTSVRKELAVSPNVAPGTGAATPAPTSSPVTNITITATESSTTAQTSPVSLTNVTLLGIHSDKAVSKHRKILVSVLFDADEEEAKLAATAKNEVVGSTEVVVPVIPLKFDERQRDVEISVVDEEENHAASVGVDNVEEAAVTCEANEVETIHVVEKKSDGEATRDEVIKTIAAAKEFDGCVGKQGLQKVDGVETFQEGMEIDDIPLIMFDEEDEVADVAVVEEAVTRAQPIHKAGAMLNTMTTIPVIDVLPVGGSEREGLAIIPETTTWVSVEGKIEQQESHDCDFPEVTGKESLESTYKTKTIKAGGAVGDSASFHGNSVITSGISAFRHPAKKVDWAAAVASDRAERRDKERKARKVDAKENVVEDPGAHGLIISGVPVEKVNWAVAVAIDRQMKKQEEDAKEVHGIPGVATFSVPKSTEKVDWAAAVAIDRQEEKKRKDRKEALGAPGHTASIVTVSKVDWAATVGSGCREGKKKAEDSMQAASGSSDAAVTRHSVVRRVNRAPTVALDRQKRKKNSRSVSAAVRKVDRGAERKQAYSVSTSSTSFDHQDERKQGEGKEARSVSSSSGPRSKVDWAAIVSLDRQEERRREEECGRREREEDERKMEEERRQEERFKEEEEEWLDSGRALVEIVDFENEEVILDFEGSEVDCDERANSGYGKAKTNESEPVLHVPAQSSIYAKDDANSSQAPRSKGVLRPIAPAFVSIPRIPFTFIGTNLSDEHPRFPVHTTTQLKPDLNPSACSFIPNTASTFRPSPPPSQDIDPEFGRVFPSFFEPPPNTSNAIAIVAPVKKPRHRRGHAKHLAELAALAAQGGAEAEIRGESSAANTRAWRNDGRTPNWAIM